MYQEVMVDLVMMIAIFPSRHIDNMLQKWLSCVQAYRKCSSKKNSEAAVIDQTSPFIPSRSRILAVIFPLAFAATWKALSF